MNAIKLNGKMTSKKAAKKLIAKTTAPKAAKVEPVSKKSSKVKPYAQLRKLQTTESTRDEERRIARKRVESRETRAALAARITMTLSKYPDRPLSGADLLEEAKKLEGVKPSKKGKKAMRNQAGTAADRKAAKREARLAAKLAKKQEREEKKAQRAAERAEKKLMQNMPQVEFSKAMLKEALDAAQAVAGFSDKRAAKLMKRVEQIANIPPRKLAKRIKTFQLRVAMMEAVMEVAKQAAASGTAKTVEQPVSKKKAAAIKAVAKQVTPNKAAKVEPKAAVSKPTFRPAPKALAGKPLSKKGYGNVGKRNGMANP